MAALAYNSESQKTELPQIDTEGRRSKPHLAAIEREKLETADHRVTMARSLRCLEVSLTGNFAALQLFAAFFLSILGLAMTFGRVDFLGAFLASLGLTFLALLAINIKRRA